MDRLAQELIDKILSYVIYVVYTAENDFAWLASKAMFKDFLAIRLVCRRFCNAKPIQDAFGEIEDYMIWFRMQGWTELNLELTLSKRLA